LEAVDRLGSVVQEELLEVSALNPAVVWVLSFATSRGLIDMAHCSALRPSLLRPPSSASACPQRICPRAVVVLPLRCLPYRCCCALDFLAVRVLRAAQAAFPCQVPAALL
jgi:hypothetical protein